MRPQTSCPRDEQSSTGAKLTSEDILFGVSSILSVYGIECNVPVRDSLNSGVNRQEGQLELENEGPMIQQKVRS